MSALVLLFPRIQKRYAKPVHNYYNRNWPTNKNVEQRDDVVGDDIRVHKLIPLLLRRWVEDSYSSESNTQRLSITVVKSLCKGISVTMCL